MNHIEGQMEDAATESNEPWPTEININSERDGLKIVFDDGNAFDITAEMMRVLSPSAEVQGHSPDQRVTVGGKRSVLIMGMEPVGRYAARVKFSDGHDTGIFTWPYLHKLGAEGASLWQAYLDELAEKGLDRG